MKKKEHRAYRTEQFRRGPTERHSLIPFDRALLRENLSLTVDERLRKFEAVARLARAFREAGARASEAIE